MFKVEVFFESHDDAIAFVKETDEGDNKATLISLMENGMAGGLFLEKD